MGLSKCTMWDWTIMFVKGPTFAQCLAHMGRYIWGLYGSHRKHLVRSNRTQMQPHCYLMLGPHDYSSNLMCQYTCSIEKVLTLQCLCPSLENLMREHMYCEPTGQKPQSQSASPMTFISPAFTISGKKAYGIMHGNKPDWTNVTGLCAAWPGVLCAQTFAWRWRCCTTARGWWKRPPVAQTGASSCRVVSPWEMNVSTGPALPSSSPSLRRAPYPCRHAWLKRWTAFFVIWREACCYGWPQRGCSSSGSARAGCTGAVPWPGTLTGPTSWSEKRRANCSMYPHFSTVRQCMHVWTKQNIKMQQQLPEGSLNSLSARKSCKSICDRIWSIQREAGCLRVKRIAMCIIALWKEACLYSLIWIFQYQMFVYRAPELCTGEGPRTFLWDWALFRRGVSRPQRA